MSYPFIIQGKNIVVVIDNQPHTISATHISYERIKAAIKANDWDTVKDIIDLAKKTPGGTWERGKQNLYTTRIHKSETVDYGILLEGERLLVLDSGTLTMKPGDVVVQLGNWHGWTNPNEGSLMAFVMMGGKYEEQP